MTTSTTPYHYGGVLTEISQALTHVVQASDWLEGAGPAREHPLTVRQAAERGNLRAALAHLRNAYQALLARETGVALDVSLAESVALAESAPTIAAALATREAAPLPEDLGT